MIRKYTWCLLKVVLLCVSATSASVFLILLRFWFVSLRCVCHLSNCVSFVCDSAILVFSVVTPIVIDVVFSSEYDGEAHIILFHILANSILRLLSIHSSIHLLGLLHYGIHHNLDYLGQ